jgi:hypothetical protein
MNPPLDAKTRWGLAVASGVAYFGIVFSFGFLLGAIRVTFIVPRVGMRAAELAEAPIMLLVTVLAALFVARRFFLPASIRARLLTGLTALSLLILAELGAVVLLQRQTLSGYLASRDPVSGSVYIVLVGLFAVMPAFLASHFGVRIFQFLGLTIGWSGRER